MDEKRAEELFADEAFVKSLLALETPEEVQAAVKAKGVDLTLDEISAIKEVLAKFTSAELSDADLENVAGGNSSFQAGINQTLSEISEIGRQLLNEKGKLTSADLLELQSKIPFDSNMVMYISNIQKSITDTLKSLAQKV